MNSETILNYWFGEIQNGFNVENKFKLWWQGGTEVDTEIKETFGTLVEKARNKELDSWKETAKGRLALIILLDQFTRNIYRGTADAFAADSYALSLTQEGLECGHDKELATIQRVFFYMPLEHSENMDNQNTCLQLMQDLNAQSENPEKTKGFVKFAEDHRTIIEKFGRYPHRNKVLGRENTDAENEYLSGEHASFGQ